MQQQLNTNYCNSYIKKSLIFHDVDAYPFPIEIINNNIDKFGILKIDAYTDDDTKKKILLMFTIDHSGSMEDMCKDRKTKLEHIVHTIKNMIKHFVNLEKTDTNTPSIFIHINIFNSKVETIIKNTQITQENVNTIIDKLKEIEPESSTNIEIALTEIKKNINEYIENNGFTNNEIIHLFLTDGEITDGESSHEKLTGLLNTNIQNTFIGFGEDHDAKLLNRLGENKNGEYYFIDYLERASIVYGEITHNILNKIFDNVSIHVDGGMIYDWRKNIWVKEMFIGPLTKDKQLIYQVKTFNPQALQVKFLTTDENTNMFVKLLDKSHDPIQPVCENLSAYVFRQKTQELLYAANHVNDNLCRNDSDTHNSSLIQDLLYSNETSLPSPNTSVRDRCICVKKDLKELLNEIKKYMESTHISETSVNRSLLKLLCDDIYVTMKTFYKRNNVFSVSRQTSQGRQHIYNATNLQTTYDDDDDNYTTIYMKSPLKRQLTTTPYHPIRKRNMTPELDYMADQNVEINNDSNVFNFNNISEEEEYNSISDTETDCYEFSRMDTSPFMTPSAMRTINNISGIN